MRECQLLTGSLFAVQLFPPSPSGGEGCGIKPSTFSLLCLNRFLNRFFFPCPFLSFPLLYFLPSSTVSLGSLLGFLPLSLLVPLILSFYPLFPEAPENTFSPLLHVTSLPSPISLSFSERGEFSPLEATTFSVSSLPPTSSAQRERRGKKRRKSERGKKKPRGLERGGPAAASSWQRAPAGNEGRAGGRGEATEGRGRDGGGVRLPRKHLPASPLLQPGPQPPACRPHPLRPAGSDRPRSEPRRPGGAAAGPHPERREGRGAAAAPGASHPALGAPAPPGRGGGEGSPPRRPSAPPTRPGARGPRHVRWTPPTPYPGSARVRSQARR